MSQLNFTKKDNYTRCMNSAVYSLAMREHSRLEIRNKLAKKDFADGVDIDRLLNELEEKNYLNEERFVESYIRYRSSRGQGNIKISNELRQRGIADSLINQFMQKSEVDWYQLAESVYQKKFGFDGSSDYQIDYKEKSKRMRFLSSRGFDSEVIRQIVK